MDKIYRCCLWLLFLGASLSMQAESWEYFYQEDTTKKEKKNKDLPLEPGRSIDISATEGSWISLDVSNDGKTIVFDFLGDLYTMPFSGGKATQITEGMMFDGQPRFSPDDKWIVFTSDRDGGENIWIMNLETKETKQITKGKANRYQSPEWTPDGDYIVASRAGMRSGTVKMHLYHKDGGGGTQLMSQPRGLKMTGAAFGPDDRYIWFAQRSGDWNYNAILPQYQIARYDRETGQRETMTFRYGSGMRPTLSPDGNWMVYGTRYNTETGLVLRNLKSGDEEWLAYPVQHDDQESRATRDALPAMSFTPDSKQLVVSYGGKIWRIGIENKRAREIPFEIETTIELGPELSFDYPIEDTETFTVKQIRDAVPSPDGSKLVFASLDRLYVMDYPNGTPQRLTQNDITEAQPAWSPDGSQIAYVTWSDEDGGNVYKVAASGGQPTRVTTENGIYQNPVWSPDGTRIVVNRGAANNYENGITAGAPGSNTELVWVNSNGGSNNFIARANGRGGAHFIEGSDRIYLFAGGRGLVSIRWDGTDEKEHLRVTGSTPPGFTNPMGASWMRMAPKGDQVLVQIRMDLYVVTMPVVGGDTPRISVANPSGAAFPAKKLTDIGGQFPSWSADATKVHWSIGNAHVVYDLAEAKRVADQIEEQKEAAKEKSDEEKEESEEDKIKPYEPAEKRIEMEATLDTPEGTAVYRGARIITMNGDEIIESGDIVVTNNRITAIGPSGQVTVPRGAKSFDVSGKTIVPGFVDTHAHMWPLWGIHKPQSWAYMANLAYGVTTTRDPQTATTDVLSFEDKVRNGSMIGPRIYSTGPGVFWQEMIKDQEHANKVIKRYSEYYDTKTLKMYVAGNRQQRQWIIQACMEQKIMPTTEGSLNFKQNLTQIIDGYPGHEHSFPVFPLYKDVIDLVSFSKTAYTPTLLVAYGGPWTENYFYEREKAHLNEKLNYFTPKLEMDSKARRRSAGWFAEEEYAHVQLAEFVKDLVEAGGRAGVGSHGQLQGLGFHWELWAMQSGGLSNHNALKVATIHGAEAIGLENDLGSLEVGKLADFVILDANPLDNIRNTDSVGQVVMNGRLYDANNLNQIHPNRVKSGKQWWHDRGPKNVPGVKK